MIDASLFIVGIIFGSFLNVCISRLPQTKSVISPASSCPNCGHRIKLYHNIPVISYLLLRGKCYYCKWSIPKRYPLVELLSGGVVILLYHYFEFKPLFFQYTVLCFFLIIITFIDIENQLILNKITFPGMMIGICFGLITNDHTIIDILAGIISGSSLLIFIAVLGKIIYKKEGMGGGDIKLAAMIGSFIGFHGVIISVLIAIYSAALIGLIITRLYKTNYIPFAPFLSVGAIIYIFMDAIILNFLSKYLY